MMGKYHNIDYEGVVLKIPSFVISANNLEPDLLALLERLRQVNLSMHHPDHLNNIYELENMSGKVSYANDRRIKDKEAIARKEKYLSDVREGRIFEIEEIKESHPLDKEYITIKNHVFDFNDYMTNKLHIKTAFIKKVNELIADRSDFIQFALNNCHMLYEHAKYSNDYILPQAYSFLCTNYAAHIGISYKRKMVKTDWQKNRNGDWRYSLSKMIIKDDIYGYHKGGNDDNIVLLDNYKLSGNKLIKTQE